MDRINSILKNEIFIAKMQQIDALEVDRIYCKHDIEHSYEVARIMQKRVLEIAENYEKEIIWATALLHDIGRADAKDSDDHAKVSVALASIILQKSGYTAAETDMIKIAIAYHREKISYNKLGEILYFADKKSRNCFSCEAADSCTWDIGKRNKEKY